MTPCFFGPKTNAPQRLQSPSLSRPSSDPRRVEKALYTVESMAALSSNSHSIGHSSTCASFSTKAAWDDDVANNVRCTCRVNEESYHHPEVNRGSNLQSYSHVDNIVPGYGSTWQRHFGGERKDATWVELPMVGAIHSMWQFPKYDPLNWSEIPRN